jgi:hypothetical protein
LGLASQLYGVGGKLLDVSESLGHPGFMLFFYGRYKGILSTASTTFYAATIVIRLSIIV